MKNLGFDSIVWGGTGWNMIWSFGVCQYLLDIGCSPPKDIGVVSGGCMPALAFCGAADINLGMVQTEELYDYGDFLFNNRFRIRYRLYLETYAKQNCMEILKDYNFYTTHTRIPKFDIYKSCDYKNREEFLDKLIAGCHVPLLFGTNLPYYENGNFLIDVINGPSWWTFENKNTLVVSPLEKSSENIIGGDLSIAKVIGIRGKQTNKDLFIEGYAAAAKWHSDTKYNRAWDIAEHWRKDRKLNYKLSKNV